jgi:hypothetical protein
VAQAFRPASRDRARETPSKLQTLTGLALKAA